MISDRVKRILERYSAATIRAAMAENPAVMTAAGWKATPEKIEQTDMEEEGVKRLQDSLEMISSIPMGDMAGELVLAIPAVQRGIGAAATLLRRYGPKGRELTRRVVEAAKNIDDVVPGSRAAADVNSELREYLIREGVSPDVLTDDLLEKITRGRRDAVVSAVNDAPSRYAVRLAPTEDALQSYSIMQPGYPQVNPYYPEGTVGYIDVTPTPLDFPAGADDTMVSFVKNITESSDDVQHGIHRFGIDAVAKDRGSVVSGYPLMHPEKTTHIWERYYPDRELLGNFGSWTPANAEPVYNTPVYRITQPSQDVLIKNADVFSAEGIGKDGKFLVDFAGDAYHADGGFLRRFDTGGAMPISPAGQYSSLPLYPFALPDYSVIGPAAVPVIDARKDAARRIRAVENSKKNPNGGWNEKEQRWYPHSSYEGGADTIAYGIKLSNGSPEAKLALKQGYLTDEQANSAVDTLVDKYYNAAQNVYDKKYGAGEWDKLSDWSQSILTDYSYNPGLAKFPSLMEGFHSGDMDKILANYKRYSGGKPLGRNKILLSEIQQLNDVYPIFRADGGKIHINPANRGKFNETKRRTGKTTEELTHSSNPLTKKRAIFAQNAAKWNHKHADGGLINRMNAAYSGDTAAMLDAIQRIKEKRNG